MRRMIYVLGLILVVASSCSSNKVTKYKFTVASERGDCLGVEPEKCLIVKKGAATDWQYLSGGIKGFDYQEGYEYVLEVAENMKRNLVGMTDDSHVKYLFVKQISKTHKASTDLPLTASATSTKPYQWGGKILNIKKVDIGQGAAKGKFTATVAEVAVTSTETDAFKVGDVIHCELVASPKATPKANGHYIFEAKNTHPAHAKGVYMLDTDVYDLLVSSNF